MASNWQEDGATLQLTTKSSLSASAWRHQHIFDLDDFSTEEIDLVLHITDSMKEVLGRPVKKVPALRGKTVMTLFYENSTRTRLSFELAAKNLSADVSNLSASTSSVTKGESLIDTFLTLESLGADIIIMRHPASGAPNLAARYVKAGIINAGDGWHAHPTQALLDMYTMKAHLGRLKGLKVTIIGDVKHSRVSRSNIWGLTIMGADVTICSPPTLLPAGLNCNGPLFPQVKVQMDIEKALRDADVVMVLRLQLERMQSGLLPSLREYARLYQLNESRLTLAKPQALVMHPGPMNEGLEIASGVAHSRQSVINEQVTNGVAVRMALLYLLAGGKKA
ncbi:MAG TPA: aspartate carbamoyltransferase catalytic subunit [Dehalococcoidales bacterium]|nr:aspartate carbamoyltransferase catalytic subunit [Dehalococcoidales bacterium]